MKCRNCKNLRWDEEYPGKPFFGWCDAIIDSPDMDIERECEHFRQATNRAFDCEKCLHKKVCELWTRQEGQDASCFCLDGCDYFSPTDRAIKSALSVQKEPEDTYPCTDHECYDRGNYHITCKSQCPYHK